MKSIGNDIVALEFINEERTHQPAFYLKFVTAGEQQLHPAVLPFTQFVWLLWAVKESAYKYLKRSQADLLFSPSKIIVQSMTFTDDKIFGDVSFIGRQLYFTAETTPKYISTVVVDQQDLQHVHSSGAHIDSSDSLAQSVEVRRLVLSRLKSIFPDADLEIEKADGGYPVIIKNGRTLNIPLSFAHHGNYVAYAFLLA